MEVGACGRAQCLDIRFAFAELRAFLAKTESSVEVGVCSSTYTLVDNTKGKAKTADLDAVQCSKKIYDECCKPFYEDKTECLCGRK